MRNSVQHGSVILIHRKSGDEWRLRYRDGQAQRSEFIGSKRQFPTKAAAEKAALKMLEIINGPRSECITISDLIARYQREAMPTRPATANSYRSIMRRIDQEWGEKRIDQFVSDMFAVGEWLKELKVIGRHPKAGAPRQASPLFKGQVRNVLHNLFEKAMLWKVVAIQTNPVAVIKLRDGSKRVKEPTVLSPEQYQQLLDDPELPLLVKTLIQVCAALGLRISEALGLKWSDIDYEAQEIRIRRSVVNGQANDTKTTTSAAKLPLHAEVIAVLQMWRMSESVVNGWVFGSERTGLPVDRDWLREEYLKPAGERLGIHIGWHSFRHSYRAHLRESNVPIETQKNLLRHSKVSTTLDIYGGKSNVDELRESNSKVVEMMKRKAG